MNPSVVLRNLNAAVDRWLLRPEPNAAGRMGLFRIVYCLFYLYHLSDHFIANLSGLAYEHHLRTFLVEWIPLYAQPTWFLNLTEASLVGAIVLLMIGYHTWLATIAVLLLGCVYEGWLISIDREHAAVMLTAFIPFFMSLSGRWGDAYSLDALLAQHAGQPRIQPSNDSCQYFLPARATLVVLAALFLTSAIFKLTPGSTWPRMPDVMGIVLLDKNISVARQGWPVNPLAPIIATRPWLYVPFQYSVILFEASLALMLVDRLRNVVLATALLFHALNALVLGVTFTAVMITYLLFVDLQYVRERLFPSPNSRGNRTPSGLLIAGTLVLATAAALSWNSPVTLRRLFNLGGWLDWRTIWLPALPLILIWWLVSLRDLILPHLARGAENVPINPSKQKIQDS